MVFVLFVFFVLFVVFVRAKSFRKKIKKFKTALITSLTLLLIFCMLINQASVLLLFTKMQHTNKRATSQKSYFVVSVFLSSEISEKSCNNYFSDCRCMAAFDSEISQIA